MLCKELPVINRLGLHARAAARLVNLASTFDSEVQLARNGRTVNGKSIMGVMMLAAGHGSKIEVRIDGPDEVHAMAQLEALVAGRFGEAE